MCEKRKDGPTGLIAIPSTEKNGIIKTYEVTCEDGVLKINFSREDIEAPTISGVTNGSIRMVEKGTPMVYAFYGMEIDDNDEIVCMEFYHGATKYKNWGRFRKGWSEYACCTRCGGE